MLQIPKEEIEKIKKIKGEIIGSTFLEDVQLIFEKEGKEGLPKLEAEMKKLGYPLKFKEIKTFQWYPFYLYLLVLLIYRNLFQWEDEVFRETGRFGAKVSIFTRIIMKYFVSLKLVCEETGRLWQKYMTTGELKAEELNEREHYVVLTVRNFTSHPLYCLILEGYFWQVSSYVLPKEKLKVQEIECIFRGGEVHKFKITW